MSLEQINSQYLTSSLELGPIESRKELYHLRLSTLCGSIEHCHASLSNLEVVIVIALNVVDLH